MENKNEQKQEKIQPCNITPQEALVMVFVDPFRIFWAFMYKLIIFFTLIFYVFIFRQREREGEREGEKHQCVVAPRMPPTGDLAHNPSMCPDREWNLRPFD